MCLDELNAHPRDVIKNWSDVFLLLGFAKLKQAQQSICKSCYKEYSERMQTCYVCGKEFFINSDGEEDYPLGSNGQPVDIKNLLIGDKSQHIVRRREL